MTVKICPAIVIVPLRSGPESGATAKVIPPLPLPVAADVIVIHGAFDTAVQPHDASDAVTDTLPLPPADGNPWLVGAIEYEHGAASVTVKVCPAIVTVPVRAGPAFGSTFSATVPGPVPVAPPVTVIHGAFDAAVQAQDGSDVETDTDAGPPAAGTGCDVGAIEYEQGAEAAA